jgi:hypothetical protein
MSAPVSGFSLTNFIRFCRALKIDTKELGRIRLGDHIIGTQQWVLDRITAGIQRSVRNFVILKCRQAGISTICLALDLYWVFKHQGLQGSLVTHDDESRDNFRETLQLYYDSLPIEWRRPAIKHNVHMFSFANRSRLRYAVAGTTKRKSSGKLGRSSANAFLHMTEMSSWADAEGLRSLRDTMAEKNPDRLYIGESTARGFNLFYDMWEDAKKAVTQEAIFVSFWANPFYRCERGTELYRAYWGKSGRMTATERAWVREVKLLYDVVITDEMLAWYRFQLFEKGNDENLLMQEHPPTENHAFIATGSQFFAARPISDTIIRTKRQDPPEYYRIDCKEEFYQTEVVGATPRIATLKVWEPPATIQQVQYVLGCDPKYGSEHTHDTNSVSVWRCYGDKCIQVAEWDDPDMPTYAVAWVMCLLAGYYEPCLVNLEINGPGQAVFDEVQKLRKKAALALTSADRKLFNVVKNIQHYLYKRVDQLSGVPNAFHTQTTYASKHRYMGNFRDYFERGYAVPMSPDLVNEMKGIVTEAGSAPAAGSTSTDDHVVSAALAVHAWSEHLMLKLNIMNITWARSQEREQNESKVTSVVESRVGQYLKRIGVAP